MPVAKFVRDNLVLVVGVTLPVLLMAGFLLASALPGRLSEPPKYDLLFWEYDYPAGVRLPVTLQLVVKDGVLTAQYTAVPVPDGAYPNGTWRKLFRYEAAAGRVRELNLPFPADMATITGTREAVVEATKGLRIETTPQSPDGYELTFGDRRGGGLLLELFGGGRESGARLSKDGHSVPITGGPGRPYYSVEFLGWVTGTN
jgi:hypothetical protein